MSQPLPCLHEASARSPCATHPYLAPTATASPCLLRKFALRLVIDMVSSVQLSACGMRVRLDVSPDPVSARRSLKPHSLELV